MPIEVPVTNLEVTIDHDKGTVSVVRETPIVVELSGLWTVTLSGLIIPAQQVRMEMIQTERETCLLPGRNGSVNAEEVPGRETDGTFPEDQSEL